MRFAVEDLLMDPIVPFAVFVTMEPGVGVPFARRRNQTVPVDSPFKPALAGKVQVSICPAVTAPAAGPA
jgi:hypothetical protein